MTLQITKQKNLEELATLFFQKSEGDWQSQRRYYTLKQDKAPQEVISTLQIRFLAQGSGELKELEQMHGLTEELKGGSEVLWDSNGTVEGGRNISKGSTVFGILGDILYRDRGYSTREPIIARYRFTDEMTLCLRTEYNGSVFEEDIKLIGDLYRTRQTIISRAQQEIMIGQYLEKRIV